MIFTLRNPQLSRVIIPQETSMRLYTAQEAAEILSLSKWTVWKYGREGKLKTVRFGRTVRYELGGVNEIRNQALSEPVQEDLR